MTNQYAPPGRESARPMLSYPGTAPRSLLVHVIAAISLYGIDALALAQGVIAGLTTLVMVVIGAAHIVHGFWADRRDIRHGLSMIVIYAVMMVSIVATIQANNRLARRRADEIVIALKLYKFTTGDYPVRLTKLVPKYMPAVPQAKYTLMFNDFRYYYDRTERRGFLMYTAFPPFGRPTYRLDTDRWGYLD